VELGGAVPRSFAPGRRAARKANMLVSGGVNPVLRVAAIATLVLAALVFAMLVAAKRADGPVEMIPGGPLSGEVERGPEPDWGFAESLDTVELQVSSSPPRSILTGIVVHGGVPYVPVTLAPLKRWPSVIARDSRVVARIDGRLFEREAVAVTDSDLLVQLITIGQSKYGPPYHARRVARFTR
jgi:hypothetical protein